MGTDERRDEYFRYSDTARRNKGGLFHYGSAFGITEGMVMNNQMIIKKPGLDRLVFRLGFIGLCVLMLNACGIMPEYQLPPPPQGKDIAVAPIIKHQRLGMLTIDEPEIFDVRVIEYQLPNPGVTMVGRMVGFGFQAAVIAGDRVNKNYELSAVLEEWDFNLSRSITRNLVYELEKSGYDVEMLPVERHRHASAIRNYAYLGRYPEHKKPIGAYFHVYIEFAGYTSLLPNGPFTPTLQVFVSLVDTETKKPIYSQMYNYGGPIPVESETDLPSPIEDNVRDFDTLCQGVGECDISPAVKGLERAAIAMAELIALNVSRHCDTCLTDPQGES